MGAERDRNEPPRGPEIATPGDVDVDDLAVLIDGSVHVALSAGDLYKGLIDEPAVADRMVARSGRIHEERRAALHPPEDGDVVNLDPMFTEKLFDVAIRKPELQLLPDGEDDDLVWDSVPAEGWTLDRGHGTGTTRSHQGTLTGRCDDAPTQQCRLAHPVALVSATRRAGFRSVGSRAHRGAHPGARRAGPRAR